MRRAAARLQCANNLKQLGLAVHGYHNSQNQFPLGTKNDKPFILSAPRTTYLLELYPYLEQETVYRRFDPNVQVATVDSYGSLQLIPW